MILKLTAWRKKDKRKEMGDSVKFRLEIRLKKIKCKLDKSKQCKKTILFHKFKKKNKILMNITLKLA